MKGKDWLILGAVAVGGYYLYTQYKKSQDSAGAAADVAGLAFQGAGIATAGNIAGVPGLDVIVKGIQGAISGLSTASSNAPVSSSPSQVWNAVTGNATANQLQNAVGTFNSAYGANVLNAVTGNTGITTVKTQTGITTPAQQKAIEDIAIAAAGATGGMSLLGGGVAYVPASQAIITPQNAQAAISAGVVNSGVTRYTGTASPGYSISGYVK